MSSARGWFDEAKAWPVSEVAQRLGLEVFRRGADVSFPCPVCGKDVRHTRDASGRKAAKVMAENRWWCEPCGAGGDVVALIAAVATGSAQPERGRYGEARILAAQLGLIVGEGESGSGPARLVVATRVAEAPAPSYPDRGQLEAFVASLRPLTGGVPGRYLASRGFSIDSLPWVRVAFDGSAAPVMPWWPAGWPEGWPIVFPAYNAKGLVTSVHARAVGPAEPKTRWPRGCSASGLLFADTLGADFLRARSTAGAVEGLEAVVLAEGATDTLKLAQVAHADGSSIAVLGYASGSKHALASIDWPHGLPCLVAFDDDAQGDRYALEALKALDGRAPVHRIRPPQGRDGSGKKLGDWSDLPDEVLLDALTNVSRWEVVDGR